MGNILNVSSKLGFCGMPLRGDSSYLCSHGCVYCFAKKKHLRNEISDRNMSPEKFKREFFSKNSLEHEFIEQGIPIHWGGMSDPFSNPADTHATVCMSKIAKDHPIIYSTKGTHFNQGKFDKETRAFQFSIAMDDDMARVLEPNTPLPSERIKKARQLKKEGFWVSVRIQPFIPNVTERIIDLLLTVEWDYITIEGMKIVSPKDKSNKLLLRESKLHKKDFCKIGLLNLRPQIKAQHYLKILPMLNGYKIGMGDNDLHFLSDSRVCCGTDTIPNWNNYFTTTTSLTVANDTTSLSDLGSLWTPNKKIKSVFYSTKRKNNTFNLFGEEEKHTVKEYFEKYFYADNSNFSPGLNIGFKRFGLVYKNIFKGLSRLEVLQIIADKAIK